MPATSGKRKAKNMLRGGSKFSDLPRSEAMRHMRFQGHIRGPGKVIDAKYVQCTYYKHYFYALVQEKTNILCNLSLPCKGQ